MVRTAIIGASGFVGRHLFARFRTVDPETVGTSFLHGVGGLEYFDVRTPDLASLRLQERGVRAVLIASAKANVGYCQENAEDAAAVNVSGTLELIRQAVRLKLQPIFISSDYVFDGLTGDHDDDAPTNPSTEYGRQKQTVENELPRISDNYLILRLSKIYGDQKGDGTLIDDLANSLMNGREVRAATDQRFSPTYVDDLVSAIAKIQERGLGGVLNVSAPTSYSRFEVAVAVARELGLPASRVTPVRLHDFPGMSYRPLNTSLLCSRLAAEVGAEFTPIERHIASVAAQWKNADAKEGV